MQATLTGKFNTWNLFGHKRTYADIHLPYSEAIALVMPVRYDALTGKGEQRALFESHAKKLKSEMLEGNFTPTQFSAGLNKQHKEKLTLDATAGTFTLEINSDDPLAQTDGGHRYGAIELILRDRKNRLAKTQDEAEKAKLQAEIDSVNSLEIGFRIYLDGNPKTDFINLQAGRPVDQAHLLSLKIQQRVLAEPEFKSGFEIAKWLHKSKGSPFEGLIRFDSRVSDKNALVKHIPISTLAMKSSSDLSTSVIGLARIGLVFDAKVSFLAACVSKVANAFTSKAPTLCERGKVLAPPLAGGTKGSATMFTGLGICLAYRVLSQGRSEITADDLMRLVASAMETLDESVDGSFPGGRKRKLMGEFARNYLSDLGMECHEGIPVGLLRALSCSAFGVTPFPKKVATDDAKQTVQSEGSATATSETPVGSVA